MKMRRFLFAFLFVLFASFFAAGVSTVKAAETQTVTTIEDEDTALASGENAGASVFLLLGGMLLIILTVVITVVATFVVTAPIVDEI